METIKLTTEIYVASSYVQDSAEKIARELRNGGWSVVMMDATSAGGILARWHPMEIWLQRPGATKEAAVSAVNAAITSTGNYSVAGALATRATQVGGGVADIVAGKESPLLTTLQLMAGAVIAVAVVGLAIYAAPLIRSGASAAKAARA